jgi:hypothetical protein
MPCGGHDIGLNVWVEDGALFFYIDRSGSFDENQQMLKLGRVRTLLDPNPFEADQPFSQTLNTQNGRVEITAGQPEVRIRLWVEVNRPVIHIEIDGDATFKATTTYESWRTEPRAISTDRRHQTATYIGYPGEVTTWPDTTEFKDGGIQFYHRNRNDKLVIDKLIAQQNLESIRDYIPDTQRNRTFGGFLRAPGMKPAGHTEGVYPLIPFKGWNLQNETPTHQQHIEIACHTDQSATLEAWESGLQSLLSASSPTLDEARETAQHWWQNFAERSYIQINQDASDPDDQGWQIGRNYALFRYMLGCNAQGDWPSKFNGHLFTTDPGHIKGMMGFREGDDLTHETVDFRQWGGGSFTAQNQRLVYWPLLKSGDADMMPTQFDYYHRALPAAEGRVKQYWGHEGCCFAEQLENFGLPIGWAWGWEDTDDAHHTRTPDLDPTLEAGTWVKYYYETQLEFCYMILEYRRFQGLDISRWMPFIRASVAFFDAHYRMRCKELTGEEFDAEGNYIFAPTKALETYEDAVNPLPIIAALTKLLPELLELPDTLSTATDRDRWTGMLGRIPALPTRKVDEHTIFAPAEQFKNEKINMEDPQMYAVFPYTIALPGTPEFEIAQNTWEHDDLKIHFKPCWGQSGIWAARLGRTEEARTLAIDKLADAPRRFPAFWGPGPDWVPDVDHGGSGMIGLQEMLMQTDGDQIRLLPAWPKDWDVDFKLHAPKQTTVEVSVRDGKILDIKVTPDIRRKDVVIAATYE